MATTLALEPVTADDHAAMDGWLAVATAARAHDLPALAPPCPLEHSRRLTWPDTEVRAWVLRDGAEVVAATELRLPLRDDPGNGYPQLVVAPHRRRRGIGRRLLGHLVEQAASAGRERLIFQSQGPLDGDDPGAGFLRSAGARLELVDIRRRLRLPTSYPAELVEQAAVASAAYRIVQWVGATPERWLDDFAVLVARMSTDPPSGGLTLAPQQWDATRVRVRDAAVAAAGQRVVVTAAVGPDGRLAAYTDVFVCEERHGHAAQGDTLVAPAHRGRRLGLRIKMANLELLGREHPEVEHVDTFNAADNRWMVAINETMGFRPLYRLGDWQLDLGDRQSGTTAAISAAASAP
jgi:GNAT superfamily N-acetyltransferase